MSRDREIVRQATLTQTGLGSALARCLAGLEERIEKLEEESGGGEDALRAWFSTDAEAGADLLAGKGGER